MASTSASNGRQGEAAAGDGVASKLHQQAAFGRGLVGLAAASTAITLLVVVSEPPPRRNAFFLALSGLFFEGMAQVCGHVAGNGGKLVTMYASASLVVAAGFTAAASLLL